MIGLGAQEVLLLFCCGAVPAIIAVIAITVSRRSARKRELDSEDEDF